MIDLSQVNKSYVLQGRSIPVLENISFSVAEGETLGLLGPSGCGKSTLLSLLAGVQQADSGRVTVNGRVAMMMQEDMLLPWRTVLDNICLAVEIRKNGSLEQARARAGELMDRFGLAGFAQSLPQQLSGGMRQRAALLRTVLAEGEIWLLDEPFARLDALTKEELQSWLLALGEQYGPTMVLVTHDMEEALRLCDRVCLFSHRPGRILDILTVDKGSPANRISQKEYIRQVFQADKEKQK